MTVLRVLLAAAPAADHAEAWALFDAAGACVRQAAGIRPRGVARAPTGSRSCSPRRRSRIAIVALPPMPASRVAGAAGFALEDQLAGPDRRASRRRVGAGSRRPRARRDHVALAACGHRRRSPECGAHRRRIRPRRACDRLEMVRARSRHRGLRAPAGWQRFPGRCAGTERRASDRACAWRSLRPGVATAAPLRVRVDAPFDEPSLARWHRETGVEFVRGTPWHWEAAGAAAFAGAIDLLPRPESREAARRRASTWDASLRRRWSSPASALALHVAASIGGMGHVAAGSATRRAGMDVARRHGRRGAGRGRVARRRSRRALAPLRGIAPRPWPARTRRRAAASRARGARAGRVAGGIREARVVCGWALDARSRARGRGRDRETSTCGCAAPACRRSLRASPNGTRMRLGGS